MFDELIRYVSHDYATVVQLSSHLASGEEQIRHTAEQ
jgi:hypothetical protein